MNTESRASATDTAQHPGCTAVNILGVVYLHTTTTDSGDLYVTHYGRPFRRHLLPENWLEKEWFEGHRARLEGSSTVYRVQTKPVNGRSLDLVVKWCRVGEEVPFDTVTLNKFAQAEFNSPYEEFALVMEMRNAKSPGIIRTHKPLGIYVPAKCLQLWQTGRSHSKMDLKKSRHRDVELDIFRQYILIYEWIKGVSAVEALEQTSIPHEQKSAMLADLTHKAIADMATKGFRVLDMKPAHVIVRPRPEQRLLRDYHAGNIPYALVDFELLERTPEHAHEVVQARRQAYLQKQRDRFRHVAHGALPSHLHAADVFGVHYVYGRSESTQGRLWTAGWEPGLFDYFLPERWRRTHKIPLSKTNEVYWTLTKDYINVVWKVSRVGETPEIGSDHPRAARILEHGYNSPFEEFALALELSRRGVNAVYPRAIYMTGSGVQAPGYVEDPRRYETHTNLWTPDGLPILARDHNYISIWGFWNGVDEMLANPNPVYCQGISLDLAQGAGYVSHVEHDRLLDLHAERLRAAGMNDLNLKGEHVLLSLTADGVLIRGPDDIPEMRHCNFELMVDTRSPLAWR